jgi:AcrR family transcriptional regulator
VTGTRSTAAGTPRRRRNQRGRGEDLRAEIIAATKALLAEIGHSDAVSIRAVADAVGVTPPSIYLHFADKDELIEAVVADVFADLDAAMVQAATTAPDTPLDRLCAYGVAYVAFAVEHAEHYRIATMERSTYPAGPEPAEPRSVADSMGELDKIIADSAFSHMVTTVTDCMTAGLFAPGDPVAVTLELWAAAHGIAALMIAKPFLPWGDKREFAYRGLRSAALGRATTDLLGDETTPADAAAWIARQHRD